MINDFFVLCGVWRVTMKYVVLMYLDTRLVLLKINAVLRFYISFDHTASFFP